MGLDHNLDFLKAGTHVGTDQFIQNNLDLNLMPTITHPTRIMRNSATLIDNIIVSQNLCGNYCSSILVDDISDHLPSVCVIKSIQRANKDPVEITSRDTRPKNMQALNEHLHTYHIVSQNLCGNYCSSILVDDISDHLPSVCVIKSIQRANKDPVEITSRDTRPKNMQALNEHLRTYQWDNLLHGKNANDAMKSLNDICPARSIYVFLKELD